MLLGHIKPFCKALVEQNNRGDVAEFDVVVGCVLFSMHFTQSKNALILNFTMTSTHGFLL